MSYQNFAGAIRWLMDKDGVGKISYDYNYTGDNLDSREIGIRALLPAKSQQNPDPPKYKVRVHGFAQS